MKHAIVTGAGGDIGACITELAVSRGYRVVAVDVRPNQIDALAYRLDGVVPIVADITDPDSVKKAFDVFDSPLDLLVNNAGLVRFGPLESLAVQDFQDVVNVNLVGSFIVARESNWGRCDRERDLDGRDSSSPGWGCVWCFQGGVSSDDRINVG